MTELALRDDTSIATIRQEPAPSRLFMTAIHMAEVYQLAEKICATQFCPKPFQGKPGDLAAAMMYGDELGLPPMAATRAVYVVAGTPGLYAKYMVAVIQAAGHEMWTVEDTPAKVTVAGKRRGSSHVEQVTWTTERARKAGYTTNKKYETDPQAMLYARAAGDVARRVAMDALGGLAYTVEELELNERTETVTVSRADAPKAKVRRAKAAPVETPEPDFDEPAAADDTKPAPQAENQRKAMHAEFKRVGIESHDNRVEFATRVLQRPVESTSDLTFDETSVVIDWLKRGPSKDVDAAVEQPQWDEPTLDADPTP